MTAEAERGNPPEKRRARTEPGAGFSLQVGPALRDSGRGHYWQGLTKASGALAILAFTGGAVLPNAHATPLPPSAQQAPVPAADPPAQTAAPLSAENQPAAPPVITYVDGQLRIKALDATLAEVLAKVSSLTGVKIDLPPTAGGERMPFVELGPGTAREILAELLSESNFDYLLAASEADPDKIESVLLMPRGKSAGKGNRTEVASRSARGPYGRPAVAPVESEVAEIAVQPAPAGNAAPDAAQPNSQPAPSAQSMQAPILQPGQSNVPKTSPVPPPASLDSQSINTQLQQMYQQRVQLNQQLHQTPP